MIVSKTLNNVKVIVKLMKSSSRPPLRHKKGIQVIQSPQARPRQSNPMKSSANGSVQSMTRNRGISINRQTGITIDKIYDPKHFQPLKSPQFSAKKSESEEMKTLTSVRSLKLISIFADSNAQSTNPLHPMGIIKQELPVTQFQIKNQKLSHFDNRCNSPILKLNGQEQQSQRESCKKESTFQKNLLRF